MATHDYNIANADGATVRSDLNTALSAIVSQNSSASAPSTTFAYQFWADTTNDLLKQRNAANSAWITILTLSTGIAATAATVSDNAITLAKMAHGTDGEIITYDATGAPATVAVGTANHVLTSNGAGSAPTFQAAGGLYASVAIIADRKASGTDSGTFTTGSWQTRDLNDEIGDPDGIVSISSNQFTLQAGTYIIKWSAPVWRVNNHVSRLYNVTDSAVTEMGSPEYAWGTDLTSNRSFGVARTTIASAKAFSIQHRCGVTYSGSGYGYKTSWGENIFTYVEIYKEA